MHPIKLIMNPAAGSGASLKSKQKICAALDDAGLVYELVETNAPGHAEELARQASLAGSTVVAAAGGDGTIHEVINGLVLAAQEQGAATAGRLAIFPCGTGNDFAASLRLATDPVTVATGIRTAGETGVCRAVDIGVAIVESVGQRGSDAEARKETRYFFNNNLGIGLEAQVVINAQKMPLLSGVLLYVAAALRTIVGYRAFPIEVEWSEVDPAGANVRRTFADEAMLVTLGNGWRSGGGFRLTPDAVLDDGLLEIGIAGKVGLLRLLGLLAKALNGKHVNDPAVTMARSDSIQIRWVNDQSFAVHTDGEVLSYAATGITVSMLPQYLEVIG